MVQRKVLNKLGIQADCIKAEKRLGSLKPTSCQNQDGKNKAIDMKKKMKKTRSIKLSDIEGLKSSSSPPPLGKTVAQPGKNPSFSVPPAVATPQKKPVIKVIDRSPNYMKSTSSSEAKKESFSSHQVSTRHAQTGSDRMNLRRRSSTGSETSSGSFNKSARTLTRTSSSKLVRTLTKSPSFKPARASNKKCSRVALCTDIDVQKATCSSTIKDSKFPPYLTLNPGGTESEGTSVLKVCPYTYCSLNGHHHTPVPPLKCFLEARRRSLKTQRSMKMEALSPRRLKPSGALDNDPASNGMGLDNSPISPLMQGSSMDFFIEIYAKSKEKDAEATTGSTQIDATGMDDPGCGIEIAQEHETDTPVSESLSEGSPHSEIDFDENLDQYCEIIFKVDTTETFQEELKQNDVDGKFGGVLFKEELSPKNLSDGKEQDCISTIDVDQSMFEVIDMEWEWGSSSSESGDEVQSSKESDDESELRVGDSSKSDRNNLHEECVISTNGSDNNMGEEVLADDAEHKVVEEDTARVDTFSQASDTLYYNQVSSTEEMSEVLAAMEEQEEEVTAEIDLMGIVASPSSTEELNVEPTSSKEKVKESKAEQIVNISYVCPEKELPTSNTGDETKAGKVADAELLIGIHDSCHVLPRADDDNNVVEDNQNNQLCEVDNDVDESSSTQDIVGESLSTQDQPSDNQHEYAHVNNKSSLDEVQDQTKFKVPTSMDPEEQSSSRMQKTSLPEGSEEGGKKELEDGASAGMDMAETLYAANEKTHHKPGSRLPFARSKVKEELPGNHNNIKWTIGRKRHEEDYDKSRKFNPREPNFLPIVPEPEAEKVDLRHQMMDERKNAEEWMLDHALQQAVTKLAPARKRKVALLVEAFETVLPVTKCETHLRHTSSGFAHGRHIQACN